MDSARDLARPPEEAKGSEKGNADPLCSNVGDDAVDMELRGDALAVVAGDVLGERRLCSAAVSSGGGGASDPLLDRDLTFSSPSSRYGSGSIGSTGTDSSVGPDCRGVPSSASVNVTRGAWLIFFWALLLDSPIANW